jgi:hypothetical protein
MTARSTAIPKTVQSVQRESLYSARLAEPTNPMSLPGRAIGARSGSRSGTGETPAMPCTDRNRAANSCFVARTRERRAPLCMSRRLWLPGA